MTRKWSQDKWLIVLQKKKSFMRGFFKGIGLVRMHGDISLISFLSIAYEVS